jgi:hypothetical protein
VLFHWLVMLRLWVRIIDIYEREIARGILVHNNLFQRYKSASSRRIQGWQVGWINVPNWNANGLVLRHSAEHLSNDDTQHNGTQYCYAACLCWETFMLSVVTRSRMLSVVAPNGFGAATNRTNIHNKTNSTFH